MNPLEAIEGAITRTDPEAPAGPGWIPEERVDLATVLAAYTIGSAWAAFREQDTGSIEPGKLADLIVVGTKRARQTPLYDPVSALVYATHGDDVSTPAKSNSTAVIEVIRGRRS